MTWFRLSDDLHDHDKTMDLETGPCFDSALSLWARAASWTSRANKAGFVPEGAAKALTRHPEAPSELVRVGFWDRVEGGYQFRNWLKYNPPPEVIAAKRQQSRDRKARYRESKAVEKQQTSLDLGTEAECTTKDDSGDMSHGTTTPLSQVSTRDTWELGSGISNSSSKISEQPACQVVELRDRSKSLSAAGYRWLDATLGGAGRAPDLVAWQQHYERIGAKPQAERTAVAKHMMLTPYIAECLKKAKPDHILRYWEDFVSGPRHGYKPPKKHNPGEVSQDHDSEPHEWLEEAAQ